MRKTILAVMMILAMVGISSAGDFETSPFNLQGDTLYLPTTGQFAVGVGYTIATFKQAVELRAETAYIANADTGDKKTFFGVGLGLNIRKAIEKAGGTWAMSSLSPTVGILGLYDATAQKKLLPAIYVSIIKVEF